MNLFFTKTRERYPAVLRIAVLGTAILAVGIASAGAQNITGTVTNGTTAKPSSGDEVSLLSLSQGMQEIAHTQTDAQGRFSFPAPTDRVPHMVRVTHQGANYFPAGGPLMEGATTAEITVYDSAKKLNGLVHTVEVDRFQTDAKQLAAIALYAIQNQSQPPRTLENEKGTFEFALPEGAELESAQVKAPGGKPVAVEASPSAQKSHYVFNYPLRPGETQFQVTYHMAYGGEAAFSPKPLAEVRHFVVMLPKSISFSAKDSQRFRVMPDSQSTVMVATNVKPGDDLGFRIAGTGVFPEEQQAEAGGQGGAMGGTQSAANDNRPGGGLGAPIDAPDPLHNYRFYILGVFALVLVAGGAYIVSKSNRRPGALIADDAMGASVSLPDVTPPNRGSMLLEAMKEELFQLEVDRQQGRINAEEYAQAKSALDETMKRALARAQNS